MSVDYQKIKDWLNEKENKDKLVLGLAFLLVFLVGYGSGNYVRSLRRQTYKPITNYTTTAAPKPAATKTAPAAVPTGSVAGANTSCLVKGNISSSGKKIYHVLGGAFYNTVKPEQCFNTEAQAQAAGFVKSGR